MEFEWDKGKNTANIAKHAVDFASINAFEWDTALAVRDGRADYGEMRFVALGYITGRLHVVTFTDRDGSRRVISLRKANARERKRYDR